MTTKSIKECLGIEKFTPVFSDTYVSVQAFAVEHNKIWSKGWISNFYRIQFHTKTYMEHGDQTLSVIPRELML